ncbi:MAG: helix-turn-helix transcriptional regulator [Victivallales bacterium]|nr:helix-turn-helix transcriptional regulator [Victivallales bacterium]
MKSKDTLDLQAIGKRMKMVRAALRKTQSTMARDLEVSLSHYSKLEIGLGGMSHGLLYTFCRTFGVDEKWFVNGTGEMPSHFIDPEKNGTRGSYTPESVQDERLERIVGMVMDPKNQSLGAKIASTLEISQVKAMTILVKGILDRAEQQQAEAAKNASR